MSIPDTSPAEDVQNQAPVGTRPNWWVSLAVVLVCLVVVSTGWVVTKLTVGNDSPSRDLADGTDPAAVATAPSVDGVSPDDARAFIRVATDIVGDATAFRIVFSVHGNDVSGELSDTPGEGAGEQGGDTFTTSPPGSAADTGIPVEDLLGEGRVIYDVEQDPTFEHVFRTVTGATVERYQMSTGQLLMKADVGASRLVTLDHPDEADRYLGSSAFASVHLEEILATSTDLVFAGVEQVELELPGQTVTHDTYLYTGTFTALRGGYDTAAESNTLTSVEGTEFRLWIDEEGYPRRLVLRSEDGIGQTHEYLSFN